MPAVNVDTREIQVTEGLATQYTDDALMEHPTENLVLLIVVIEGITSVHQLYLAAEGSDEGEIR